MAAAMSRQASVAGLAGGGPRFAGSVSAAQPSAPDLPARLFALACFALLLGMNIAIPSFMLGPLPLRGGVAGGLLVLCVLVYPAAVVTAFRRYRLVEFLALGLATLGLFVSLVNGKSFELIVRTIVESHLQAVLTVIIAAVLAEIAGARACLKIIVAAIAISAFVAVLQFFGSEAAWGWRAALNAFPSGDPGGLEPLLAKRPSGLSYSAINLGGQLCLALGAVLAVRDIDRRRTSPKLAVDPAMFFALALFVVANILSGNRSPILGGMIFFALYMVRRVSFWVAGLCVVGSAILDLAWPLLYDAVAGAQPRVISAEDPSALGRLTLLQYGVQLFLANPLGYGFGFDPRVFWMDHWRDMYEMTQAEVIQVSVLHNYLLSMLNVYGIGLLLLLPLCAAILYRTRYCFLFFVPYVVHILFHNSAPFMGDTIVWIVIAVVAAAYWENRTAASPHDSRLAVRSRPAGRAFAPTVVNGPAPHFGAPLLPAPPALN
jgi:hypothetical protein